MNRIKGLFRDAGLVVIILFAMLFSKSWFPKRKRDDKPKF